MLFCNYCGFFTTFAETYERREPTPGPGSLTGFMGVGKKEFSPYRSIKSFVVPLKESFQVEQQKVSWKLEWKADHWYVRWSLNSLLEGAFVCVRHGAVWSSQITGFLPFPPVAVLNLIHSHENRPQQTARRRGHASHRAGDLLPASEHQTVQANINSRQGSLSHQPSQVDVNTAHTQLQKPPLDLNDYRAGKNIWGNSTNYLRAIRIFNMILINSERTNIWSDEIRAGDSDWERRRSELHHHYVLCLPSSAL